MVRIKYYSILALSILIGSCHHENSQVYPTEFKEYVDEFFYQANQHGLGLYAENLNFSIQFGETEPGNGGSCSFNGNEITINQSDWQLRDHRQKEHSIFHELGHCILNRNHQNVETSSNECFSYMKGTENDFDCSFNLYSDYWRTYYLDELFDESTTLPEWYLSNQDIANAGFSFIDSVVINDTIAEMLEINTIRFSQCDTFLLEFEFNNTNTEERIIFFNLGNLRFTHCNECALTKTSLQLGNTRIYATSDIALNTDVKFSIIRNKDVISFFVNEYFVHAMEYAIIDGNRLKTETFDEEMGMRIKYLFN